MARYVKSHSNYVLKKQHQFVKNGTIFERDWVTVGGNSRFTPGQIPVYANGNFIFTVNNTPLSQKKQKYGHWVTSPDGDIYWTDEEVKDINLPDTNSDVEINEISNDLRDFAYFGSCSELIRASIEDIIKNFPAELYFSSKKAYIATGDTESQNPFQEVEGFVVDNNFNINMIDNNVVLTEYDNDLRYFSQSFADYDIIIGNGNPTPITSVSIVNENVDVNCLTEGQLLNTITINGSIVIKGRFVNGERQFFHNSVIGTHIRPNETRINNYFKNLDGFEKVLLNRKSKPIYTNTFLTPIETNKGIVFMNRKYSWAVANGWNLDISTPNYLSFVNDLTSAAEILDEYYCDNIYRSMTHEAIKNFDWTYTREYNEGDEQKYVIAGNKVVNVLRIYGRILDDVKRYIDGIKSTNTITYDRKNNISDYLLSDKLGLSGWETSTVVKSGTENEETDILYSGESTGYTYSEVNNQFMRRLLLCSKAIFKAKGTRKSIEMLMAMFGIGKDKYSLKEYYRTTSAITDQSKITKIKDGNADKNIVLVDEDDPYSGLMVKEIDENGTISLVPWFDNNKTYDGNPYFQSNGGWGSEKPFDGGNFVYRETMPYIHMVSTIPELFSLNTGNLSPNDVYYVYDITDINNYDFGYDNPSLSGNPSNYFILNNDTSISEYENINNSTTASGWTCVTYNTVGKDKVISNPRVVYLESIISKNYGNNPHIGYGHYDMGEEYFEYLQRLFKYSIDNVLIEDAEQYEGIGFTVSGKIEDKTDTTKTIKIISKVETIDLPKAGRNADDKKIYLNDKFFVIKNNNGENKEFCEYFMDYILPYVEQLIPSTAIFGLEGFDGSNGKYLSLSTNEIRLNESMNSVDSQNFTVNASNTWKSSPSSTLTDLGTKTGGEGSTDITVKKKKYGSEKITFALNEDSSVNAILNIIVSQISSSDININDASGGTGSATVTVNGSNSNPDYYFRSNVPWANVTNNGNSISVTASQNYSHNQRNGTITVYNSNDSNCYWVINVTQAGAELGIESSCLYQTKTDDTPDCVNEVPYEGGVYYIDVKAVGGSQDFNFLLTKGDENSVITCAKVNSKLLKVTIGENTKTYDIDFIINFTHVNSEETKSETSFKQLKASGLSISVNDKNKADGEVQYNGGTITPNFTVKAEGASKTWKIVESTVPSWLTYKIDVNNLTFTAKSTEGKDSRTATVTVCHNDDENVKAYIEVIQNGIGEYGIEANPDNLSFGSNGGGVVVTVKVYGGLKNYTITSPCDWVTYTNNTVGDMGGYKEYSLVVSAGQYKSTSSNRTCILTLVHNNSTTTTKRINITQSPATAYDIYATKIGESAKVTSVTDIPFTRSTEETGMKFDVYTMPENANYITNGSTSWIHQTTNGKVLTVWFDANTSQSERSGDIILKNALDTTKTHTITFTQSGAGSLFIGGKLPSESEYDSNVSLEFNSASGDKQVDVKVEGGTAKFKLDTTNASRYSWIHVTPTSGGTGKITVRCDSNPQNNNRTGSIILVHDDNSDYSLLIDVVQTQGYQLTIEPNDGGSSSNKSTLSDVAQSGIIKSYNIAALGGEAKYKYTGSDYNWITGNDRPLTSLSSGTADTLFKLQVMANDLGTARNATLTFEHVNDSSKKVSIVISQGVVTYNILIDSQKLVYWNEVEAIEIEKTFNITVNGGSTQYLVEEPLTCTFNEETGTYTEGSGVADWVNTFKQGNILKIGLNENGLQTIRAAKIKVKHSDKPNEVYAELYLWQKAAIIEYKNYQIKPIPISKTFSETGGTATVKISSTRDRYVNGNLTRTENVPYKITVESDEPSTYTNTFKVYGKETDHTIDIVASGQSLNISVISVLKNDVTGVENPIAWNATSDSTWLKIDYMDNSRITAKTLENSTNSSRNGKITFVQDTENPKRIVVTFNQEHYPQVVKWSDPVENSTKEIDINGGTFIAYADTTALTYNDVTVTKDPNDTWVTVSNPTMGDNEYGAKAIKVEITVDENSEADRELSVIINKK